MTDRIDFGDRPWQAIPREVLRDSRLSPRAKGGLVTLLSHEDGWVRSAIGILQRECRAGRAQAQAIMRELRETGYAELVRERTLEGRIVSHYVVRAVPETTSSTAGSSESPVGGVPTRRESHPSGIRAAVVEPLDVEPQDEEPQSLEPVLGASSFETFFRTFPTARKGSRREVKRAWDKAIRRVAPETLILAAARYRDDPNRENEFTAGAARWLNRDGWEEGPLPARGRREGTLDRMTRDLIEEVNGDRHHAAVASARAAAPRELPGVAS